MGATPKKGVLFVAIISLQFWGEVHPSIFAVQIRHYITNVTELDTGNSFVQITTSTEFTFYSLHPYYAYAFTVTAMTVDIGPTSNSIIVMTEEGGV